MSRLEALVDAYLKARKGTRAQKRDALRAVIDEVERLKSNREKRGAK